MRPAATMCSCSAMAMAGSWRCKWPFAIPTSQPNSFSPIAARRSRKKAGKPFATWPRHPRPRGCRRLPTLRCAGCDALAELDLRPELTKVKVPVLVLVGEHDEATPPPMSRELAAGLPHAHLKIIPGCAHVPQLQSPEVFLEAIGDFLPAL